MNEVQKAVANLAPGVRQEMEAGFRRLSVRQLKDKNERLIREREALRRERATNPSPELDRRIMAHCVEVEILGEYVRKTFS